MTTTSENIIRRSGRRLAAVCALLGALATTPAFAGAARVPAPESSAGSAVATRQTPEQTPRRVTKFEARRIRHGCYGRAGEKGLRGAERDAYLSRCYFDRLAHRAERRQCRQQAAAQGLERAAARDFVRECVKERVRQKE